MHDLRLAVVAVNATLISLSLAAMTCRLGRSLYIVRSFGWNDAFITAATFLACVASCLMIVSSHYGIGRTVSEVPPTDFTPILKFVMASCVFYFACNWAIKHSLLLFYSGFTIDRWPRLSVYFMHGVAISFGLTCIVTVIFQCTPVSAEWDLKLHGRCINIMAFHLFNSSFMLATDTVLYVMPLVFTWNLRLQRAQRIGLNIMFALGGLVLAASAARVHAVHSQTVKPDITYNYALIMIWGLVENHIAIVIACAPSIKVLLLQAFPSLGTTFEKLVSGASSQGNQGFRSSAMSLDVEAQLKAQEHAAARPVSSRFNSTESAQSRIVKWWRAPSNWQVDPAT